MAQKMRYWLLKVEPSDYPWSQMVADRTTQWSGIRSHQAQNYLRTMKLGDLAFFYHTEKERAIVGIVKVVKEFYNTTDPKFGEIDVEAVEKLSNPVSLTAIKESGKLQALYILRQPRVSISPVQPEEWETIIELSKNP